MHSHTDQNNAGATFTFEGNSIAAFGTTSPAHGMYSVQLDDGVPTVLNGTSPELREQSLLVRHGPSMSAILTERLTQRVL